MIKLLILTGLVYIGYKLVMPKRIDSQEVNDDSEYIDYEEIE